MRKTILPLSAALSALMLTACGSGDSTLNYAGEKNYDGAMYAETTQAYYDSYETDEDNMYGESMVSYDMAEASGSDASSGAADGIEAAKIRREMLVYSCEMQLDTLDFAGTLDGFRERLDSYGGFIEDERYSDGGSGGRWYYDSEEKWQSYTATVRVPSKDYDSFCTDISQLGDLRSKNASVDNLSSEYYDLSVTLEIYQAKEDRYIQLLADITDDKYAIEVERELTNLQVEIARIKTRMNTIETDVAYSYVDITISEVKEYTAEPVKTDTFGQRLSNTVRETVSDFGDFLEWALFALIALFPYAVFIGLIIFIIARIRKAVNKRRSKKQAAGSENAESKVELGRKRSEKNIPLEYNYPADGNTDGEKNKE
ncbi:MAG: DUF4349 domain-containing protein [Ruminococcus sp.]|nr:DUF4349 domain-containing protein [Ruminococcus sp.]